MAVQYNGNVNAEFQRPAPQYVDDPHSSQSAKCEMEASSVTATDVSVCVCMYVYVHVYVYVYVYHHGCVKIAVQHVRNKCTKPSIVIHCSVFVFRTSSVLAPHFDYSQRLAVGR